MTKATPKEKAAARRKFYEAARQVVARHEKTLKLKRVESYVGMVWLKLLADMRDAMLVLGLPVTRDDSKRRAKK